MSFIPSLDLTETEALTWSHWVGTTRWCQPVLESWPTPLAEPYARLQSFVEAGHVFAAIWQLRVFCEVLLQVPAVVLLADLQANEPDPDRKTAKTGLKSFLSRSRALGDWLALVENTLAPPIFKSAAGSAYVTRSIAGLFLQRSPSGALGPTPFKLFLNNFLTYRNEELAHGGLRTASEYAASLQKWLPLLNKELEQLADRLPWDGLTLEVPGIPAPLVGAIGISASGYPPADTCWPAELVTLGRRLSLGPFLARRPCTDCGQEPGHGLFLYSGVKGSGKFPVYQYRDLSSSHRISVPGHRDERMLELHQTVAMAWDPLPGNTESAFLPPGVVELIKAADMEADYMAPNYLRIALREFLTREPRGIFWLQAPQHTGKSQFCRGLAGVLSGYDEPLNEPDDSQGQVIPLVWHIRREYMSYAVQLQEFLHKALRERFGTLRNTEGLPELDIKAPEGGLALVTHLEEVHRRLCPRDRLVLVLDGLDELPRATQKQRSVLEFLPAPGSLPEGCYIVLTSRPPSGFDAANWRLLAGRLGSEAGPGFQVVEVEPIGEGGVGSNLSAGYYDLLKEYSAWHLGAKRTEELWPLILEKSQGLFLYVSFLVRRLKHQELKPATLETLGRGEALSQDYLERAEKGLEGAPAQEVKKLLCLLAAVEEAHIQDETLHPEAYRSGEFRGLPLDLLASMMELPVTEEGIPLDLVLLMGVLKGALGTWKGDAHLPTGYRLGLKGLKEQVRVMWPGSLNATHDRWIATALSTLVEHREHICVNTSSQQQELHLLMGSLMASATRSGAGQSKSAHVGVIPTLLRDETAFALVPAYENLGRMSFDLGRFAEGIRNFDRVIRLIWFRIEAGIQARMSVPAQWIHELFRCHIDRGSCFSTLNSLQQAVSDYSIAIEVWGDLVTLHESSGEDPAPEAQNNLAIAHMGRATARLALGQPSEALSDCGAALAVSESLRDWCGQRPHSWQPEWQDTLAVAHLNRGLANNHMQSSRQALRDFRCAIEVCKDLQQWCARNTLTYDNKWALTTANSYAHMGAALAQQKKRVGAIGAFSRAIACLVGLSNSRADARQVFSPVSQHHLAQTLLFRGNAYLEIGRNAEAIRDYDAALGIVNELHKHYVDERQPWPEAWQMTMADVYIARATVRVANDVKRAARELSTGARLYSQLVVLGEVKHLRHALQLWDRAFMLHLRVGDSSALAKCLAECTYFVGQACDALLETPVLDEVIQCTAGIRSFLMSFPESDLDQYLSMFTDPTLLPVTRLFLGRSG